MKQEVKIGQTDYTVLILIRDTNGAPKTGLVFNSAGIDVCYTRVETDNDVALTAGAPVDLATPLLTDPHLDWGFLQVDATNAPGVYRLDLPDGVFAAGAWSAIVSLICTGCDPTHIEFMLIPEAPYAGVDVASIGGTAQTANDNGADINEILTDTETTLDTLIKDIPTTAELALRTLLAADYVVVGDTIAGVTAVTNDVGITQAGADKAWGTAARVLTAGTNLNDISTAEVNAEVLDVLNVDTFAEPGQEVPTATTSLVDKISYLYKFMRNKITNDGTDIKVYNDAGAVVDQKSGVSEAAGTVTRDEFASGP